MVSTRSASRAACTGAVGGGSGRFVLAAASPIALRIPCMSSSSLAKESSIIGCWITLRRGLAIRIYGTQPDLGNGAKRRQYNITSARVNSRSTAFAALNALGGGDDPRGGYQVHESSSDLTYRALFYSESSLTTKGGRLKLTSSQCTTKTSPAQRNPKQHLASAAALWLEARGEVQLVGLAVRTHDDLQVVAARAQHGYGAIA